MKIRSIISSNNLNGLSYPQKIQSTIVRSFCLSKGWAVGLHSTAMINDESILERDVFSDMEITDLVFFSKYQIVNLSGAEVLKLSQKMKEEALNVHFALEGDELSNAEELKLIKRDCSLIESNRSNVCEIKKTQERRNKIFPLVTTNHTSTKRNYQSRATDLKPKFARKAKEFEFDYWDGHRDTGYGGYHDDGRWKPIAKRIAENYSLKNGSTILDIGCGKGYLLNSLQELLPDSTVMGLEVSSYAAENAAPLVKNNILKGSAEILPFADNSFDFVFSNMALHNLELPGLFEALKEIERVSKGKSWIGVESYRTEEEKWNLMRWQLTCECFFTPKEWEWIFKEAGYSGDYELIFFE